VGVKSDPLGRRRPAVQNFGSGTPITSPQMVNGDLKLRVLGKRKCILTSEKSEKSY